MPNPRSGFRIVVAGGGFAGGTLALALAKLAPKTCGVTLVDAAPQSAPRARDGRGLALSPSSKNLLDAIGLWPRLEPGAQPMTSIEVTDSPLNAALRPHLLGFAEDVADGEAHAWLVEAGALLEAIEDAASSAAPTIELMRIVGNLRNRCLWHRCPSRERPDSARRTSRGCRRQEVPPARPGWDPLHRLVLRPNGHRRHGRSPRRPHHGRAVQHFLHPAPSPFCRSRATGPRSSGPRKRTRRKTW